MMTRNLIAVGLIATGLSASAWAYEEIPVTDGGTVHAGGPSAEAQGVQPRHVAGPLLLRAHF